MADLYNNAEGTSGNAVPTTNAGGPNAFDTSTISGVGTTLNYSNTHAHTGTTAMQIHLATVASTAYVAWSTLPGTPVASAFLRLYYYATAAPTVATRLGTFMGAAATRCSLRINATGTLATQDVSGTTISNPTATLPLNQWVRVEFEITGISGTTGTVAIRFFSGANLERNTPDTNGSGSASSSNIGGTVDTARVGVANAGTETVAYDAWVDDVGFSSVATPGPHTDLPELVMAPRIAA